MQVFRVKNAIIHVKDTEVEGWCTGLEYLQGRWIMGYESEPLKVEMVSEEGDILHTLTTDSSGDNLFRKPDYILVDNTTDNHRVLVSDRGKEKLYMLSSELQLLHAFQHPSPGESQGMAAVGGGQVLVADAGTWTLQLLDLTTGQWRAVLGREEFQRMPTCLVYNPSTRCVFVGGIGDEVRVYTMSK